MAIQLLKYSLSGFFIVPQSTVCPVMYFFKVENEFFLIGRRQQQSKTFEIDKIKNTYL